jgi:hypothetical protein
MWSAGRVTANILYCQHGHVAWKPLAATASLLDVAPFCSHVQNVRHVHVDVRDNRDPHTGIGAGTIVCAYLLAAIAPLLGLVGAIYLIGKGEAGHGLASLICSIFFFFVWYSIIA